MVISRLCGVFQWANHDLAIHRVAIQLDFAALAVCVHPDRAYAGPVTSTLTGLVDVLANVASPMRWWGAFSLGLAF